MIKTTKRQVIYLALGLLILSSYLTQGSVNDKETEKKTLRRSESFFGLHFDFHAANTDSLIGKTFTYEMVDSMLTLVKPDYIQVDCKGHPGISSYPTKIGNPAPGFIKDPMKIWREVTRKHGVALFVHYSGVWDGASAQKHPDWMEIDANGNPIDGKMSVKGPYVDKLLIPQFKELIDSYNIDGCWIDGECWAVNPDYSSYMLNAYKAETGISDVPKSFNAPGGYEFYEYNRKAFKSYIAHYVDELHKYKPDFQITSNWAFSSEMPEPVDINLDFISGDFSPNNSVYSGLYESRCISPQHKPWDLMSWSFAYDSKTGVVATKSAAQLEQLAATVMSMGGGYQVYFQQNHDASIRPWQFGLMKDISTFCRERQPYCQGATPVPQIALLYSSENYKKYAGKLYGNASFNDPLKGILNLMLDSQNAVEILMNHHLVKRMNEYPLIVIPEYEYLNDSFRTKLLDYVKNGGNLLIVGAKATSLFAEPLNVEMKDTAFIANQIISSNNQMAGISTLIQPIQAKNGAEILGNRFHITDFRFPSAPAATISTLGKGKIAGVYFNIGKNYLESKNTVYRDFINSIIHRLFQNPIVEITGSENIAITVNRLDSKLAINLINMSGEHANKNVARYNEIPVVGPLTIRIRLESRPKKVMLQPENRLLKYSYSNGIMETTIDRLLIHSIIVIE